MIIEQIYPKMATLPSRIDIFSILQEWWKHLFLPDKLLITILDHQEYIICLLRLKEEEQFLWKWVRTMDRFNIL